MFPPRNSLRLPWLVVGLCCVLAAACGDSANRAKSDPLVQWDSPEPSPLVFPPKKAGSPQGGGGSAGNGHEDVEPEEPERGAASTIEIDPPRKTSIYCGDGAWDPATEECDAGPVAWGQGQTVCSATCQTQDVLGVSPNLATKGGDRRLGHGRHPMSGSELSGGLVWVERGLPNLLADGTPGSIPQIVLQSFDFKGSPTQQIVVADQNEGQRPVLESNPVVAALPNGEMVVAYNSLNGDGSELGVALATFAKDDYLKPLSPWVVKSRGFANLTTFGAQQDADLAWTRDGLMAAWVDWSSGDGAKIVRRVLRSADFGPGGSEIVESAVESTLGSVALTGLPQSLRSTSHQDRAWALAFRRAETEELDSIIVKAAGRAVTIHPAWIDGQPGALSLDPLTGLGGGSGADVDAVPAMPGHADDRPAIAHLDGDRLLVAFSVGLDPEDTGVANVFRIWLAVVHLEFGLVESIAALEPLESSWVNGPRSLRSASLTATQEGSVYLAWRSEGALGDPRGEDVWLKRVDWNPTSQTLDLSIPEVYLAREVGRQAGDQRAPALVPFLVPGQGRMDQPALGIAIEDWSGNYSPFQGRPEVVYQITPTPVRRGPLITDSCTLGSCGIGEGPCADDSECQAGLSCHQNRGPWYGRGHRVAVCEPDHCNNGVRDQGEDGVDCGDECGVCFSCLDAMTYSGTADYCSLVCPCRRREGDCDASYECEAGMECVEDVGSLVQLPDEIDLCDYGHCHDGLLNSGEVRRDCGGEDCAACQNGASDYCQDVPCSVGEGDCLETGALCAEGLVCSATDAALYGLPSDVGVCIEFSCPAQRGDPYDADFCSEECKCPAGYGVCDSDAECLDSKCVAGRGLYFGLLASDPVCVPDHCFDHIQNYDETNVDCGGVCGNECPTCDIDPSFRSVEDSSLWGVTQFYPVGRIVTSAIGSDSDATDGNASLSYTGCGFSNGASVVFDGTQFEVVGDKLLIDANLRVGGGGNSWDWIGGFEVSVWVDGTVYQLAPSKTWTRAEANAWFTLEVDVPLAVQQAFLAGDRNIQWRLQLNRNCGAAGSEAGAVLVDNFRFGGLAVFRSECSEGGTGGSGGSTGTGGSSSGGASGTGGGSSGGAASGTGGNGTGGGGDSGSGGAGPGTTVAALFGFEDLSLWGGGVSSNDRTQGNQALALAAGAQSLISIPFKGTDVTATSLLTLDYKLPADVTPGSVNGQIELHLDCPGAGIYGNYLGQIGLWDKANQTWLHGSFQVSTQQVAALGTTAQCTLRLGSNLWGAAPGAVLLIDNLAFKQPGYCQSFQQLDEPPYVSGVSPLPDGTAARPYRICTTAQMMSLASDSGQWNSVFKLEADLSVAGLGAAIGTSAVPFTGSFDGQGHSLTGVKRYAYGKTNVGLFGRILGDGVLDGASDGLVENLILLDSIVSGAKNVGVLAGELENGVIRDVQVWGATVEASLGVAGAVVGASAGALVGLQSDANVSGAGTDLGGLVGLNAGTIDNCVALGSVNASGGAGGVGGIVGRTLGGSIVSSQSHVAVTAEAQAVGGLAGLAKDTQLLDLWAAGAVSAGEYNEVGGFAGSITGGSVEAAHATGDVLGSSSVAGLIGMLDDAVVARSSATGVVSGLNSVGGLVGNALPGAKLTKTAARGDVDGIGIGIGGLIGSTVGLVLHDSYASGIVRGGESVGGLIGYAATSKIVRTFSSGAVSGSALVGAFLGNYDSDTTAVSSYASADAGLPSGGASAGLGGVSLLSVIDFGLQESFVAWDFVRNWRMANVRPDLRFEAICDDVSPCAAGFVCSLGECVAPDSLSIQSGMRVDTLTTAVGFEQDVAVDALGRAVLIYRQATASDNSYGSLRAFAATGDLKTGGWRAPVQLSVSVAPVRNMRALTTGDGTGVVTWVEGAVGDPETRLWAAAVDLETGAFSVPVVVSGSSGERPETPDLAIAPDGSILMVWSEGSPGAVIGWSIFEPATSTFTSPQYFPYASGETEEAWTPVVSVADDGTAAIIWSEYGSQQISSATGTESGSAPVIVTANLLQSSPTWTTPVRLTAPNLGMNTFSLDVAASRGGGIVAVYTVYDSADEDYRQNLHASRCALEGGICSSWTEEVIADLWDEGLQFGSASVVADVFGGAWVISRAETPVATAPFQGPPYNHYAVRLQADAWTAPKLLTSAHTNREWPAIGGSLVGGAAALWTEGGQTFLSRFDADLAEWDAATVLNGSVPALIAASPKLAMADNGVIAAAWVQRVSGGVNHVYVGGFW